LIYKSPPGATAQSYTVVPDAVNATDLTIESRTPGFAFNAILIDSTGNIVAVVNGALERVVLALPAGSLPYEIVVSSADSSVGGAIYVSTTGSAPTGTTAPTTTDSSAAPTTAQIPAGVCGAVPANANGVNVRSGPGTEYSTIGSLTSDSYVAVTGQYNGWYYGQYRGVDAWVAGSVVTLQGPCDNLPIVNPPPPPAQPVAPDPVATEEVTDTTGQATPTATTTGDTNTPPTATPPQDTGAPLDADQLSFEVTRDQGGQYTNSVSSPTGDTSDRIRFAISDLNSSIGAQTRNFTFTMVCSGSGTENLRWGTGGPTSPQGMSCGGSLSGMHGYQSNQTYINVSMVGDGNVSYTLVVSINQ